MQKVYAYVDESGQDTQGQLFLVAVVMVEQARDELIELLEDLERTSKKGLNKWRKAQHVTRVKYIQQVLRQPLLKGKLFYGQHENTTDYVTATVETTAQAIKLYVTEPYKATVTVDGLRKTERKIFGVQLRKHGIRTELVRGATDESEIFIRLADALCGFVRDALGGDPVYLPIFEKAVVEGYLIKVGIEEK